MDPAHATVERESATGAAVARMPQTAPRTPLRSEAAGWARERALDEARRRRETDRRQRQRQIAVRRRRAGAVLLFVVTLGSVAAAGSWVREASTDSAARVGPGSVTAGTPALAPPTPEPERVRQAVGYARARAGTAAFAVVDTDGRMHGVNQRRRFSSASVVKATILLAYLDLVERRGQELAASERAQLAAMIRYSDNGSASRLAAAVGAEGLARAARRAGMRNTTPQVGRWGLTQTTAEDQARLFSQLERLTPSRHRGYARRLLQTIVPEQRWGVPRGVAPAATVAFKGGWAPGPDGRWMVHQAAQIGQRGRRMSLAVMTGSNPSQRYGQETIEGITERLVR